MLEVGTSSFLSVVTGAWILGTFLLIFFALWIAVKV
jgi:hypothetical protein